MKVYLNFDNRFFLYQQCAISGKVFPNKNFLYFTLEDKSPVSPEAALENGFTVKPEDLTELNELLDHVFTFAQQDRSLDDEPDISFNLKRVNENFARLADIKNVLKDSTYFGF